MESFPFQFYLVQKVRRLRQFKAVGNGPGGQGETVLLLAVSVAKNRDWLATLMTIWRVKFRPIVMILWHLEGWPADHLPLRLILKFPNLS